MLRQAGIELHYLKSTRGKKTPDYLVAGGPDKLVVEIGGPGKGRQQFKGIEIDRKLVFAHTDIPTASTIPLVPDRLSRLTEYSPPKRGTPCGDALCALQSLRVPFHALGVFVVTCNPLRPFLICGFVFRSPFPLRLPPQPPLRDLLFS